MNVKLVILLFFELFVGLSFISQQIILGYTDVYGPTNNLLRGMQCVLAIVVLTLYCLLITCERRINPHTFKRLTYYYRADVFWSSVFHGSHYGDIMAIFILQSVQAMLPHELIANIRVICIALSIGIMAILCIRTCCMCYNYRFIGMPLSEDETKFGELHDVLTRGC